MDNATENQTSKPSWRDFVHEGGHAVMIEYFGGRVLSIDFTSEGHDRGISIGRTESAPRQATFDELIHVAMAGVAAETVIAQAPNDDNLVHAAVCDQENLRQHLAEVDGTVIDMEFFVAKCVAGKANMVATIKAKPELIKRIERLARGLHQRYEAGFTRTEGSHLRSLMD